jgi:hypothetical protein
VLCLNGKDLRYRSLHQCKRTLVRIMPQVESRVRLVQHVEGCGVVTEALTNLAELVRRTKQSDP